MMDKDHGECGKKWERAAFYYFDLLLYSISLIKLKLQQLLCMPRVDSLYSFLIKYLSQTLIHCPALSFYHVRWRKWEVSTV